MKEKINELDNLLTIKLSEYGFKRTKKTTYTKNMNEGIYGINLSTTKIKGKDKIHVYVMLTFDFERLNNLIMYLMNDYSYKGWKTIAVNAVNIVPDDNVFGFYVEKDTNLEIIVDLIIKAFEKYGLHIFDDIDTCEKLQKKLYEDKKSIINWLVYKQEWYFLALAVMNNNYSINDIVDKFINEFNNIDGTIEELRKRISYDEKVKEILR